jgi:hypothetical protein
MWRTSENCSKVKSLQGCVSSSTDVDAISLTTGASQFEPVGLGDHRKIRKSSSMACQSNRRRSAGQHSKSVSSQVPTGPDPSAI